MTIRNTFVPSAETGDHFIHHSKWSSMLFKAGFKVTFHPRFFSPCSTGTDHVVCSFPSDMSPCELYTLWSAGVSRQDTVLGSPGAALSSQRLLSGVAAYPSGAGPVDPTTSHGFVSLITPAPCVARLSPDWKALAVLAVLDPGPPVYLCDAK